MRGAAEAMPACWTGTVQPTNSVNLMVIMSGSHFLMFLLSPWAAASGIPSISNLPR